MDARWNFNLFWLKSCFTVVVPGFPWNLYTKLTETLRQINSMNLAQNLPKAAQKALKRSAFWHGQLQEYLLIGAMSSSNVCADSCTGWPHDAAERSDIFVSLLPSVFVSIRCPRKVRLDVAWEVVSVSALVRVRVYICIHT